MIPPMLAANPRLGRWVSFEPGGVVRIAFGRMEYGQGIGTSLAQMAAEELDLPLARVRVAPAATGTPCRNRRETCGAATHRPAAAATPISVTGITAMARIRRTSSRPPIARARDIHLVKPVSAPSSKVLDKIVNRATSS